MRQHINLTLEEKLIVKAKSLNLNISEFLNTSLGAYLMGVPDELIKGYVNMNTTQRGKVNRKLIRISKQIFGGEIKK